MPLHQLVLRGALHRCLLLLQLVDARLRVAPQPRRAFQGWRYLKPEDAPPDLTEAESADLPPDLARQLRELGAW